MHAQDTCTMIHVWGGGHGPLGVAVVSGVGNQQLVQPLHKLALTVSDTGPPGELVSF